MKDLEEINYIKGFGGKGGGGGQAPPPTPAYEDIEGFVYNGQNYNVYQFAKVKDLLSEGPIEGLVQGEYSYKGRVGDLGYTGVYFDEYPTAVGENAASNFLRSVQWNDNPLLDSQNKYNFQQIDINVAKGSAVGTSVGGEFDNVSYIRSIGERLRGPNKLAINEDEISDYKKTYRIINKECKKININFRISSLYTSLKYQDLASTKQYNPINPIKIEGVQFSDGFSYFQLTTADRELENGQTDIKAGVGSVIYNKFQIRIKTTPIYKEGYNNNLPGLDIVSSAAQTITDEKDLVIVQQSAQQIFEIECKGKITQGYVKQIILDLSQVFPGLNANDNWIGWDVSIIKITPEDTFSSRASFISIDTITEIYSSSFRYPNSAIVTSKFNAAYFSKVPSRTYDAKLLKVKVPKNYDPLTKTYGNTDTLTINETENFFGGTREESLDYYFGENNQYGNDNNIVTPIFNGLIAQFDAANTANGGANTAVTNWPNRIAGSPVTCTLSASKPTYGKPGETSPNGSLGVSFTTAQNATFLDGTKFLSDANGNCTVFIVSKWDNSATSAQRNTILQGFYNRWFLGFYDRANSNFYFGGWAYGGFDRNDIFNSSNYYPGATNDSNTYIAGAVIKSTNDINLFWQNSIFYKKLNFKPTAPQGLQINKQQYAASACTVFEILVYNRALSKEEALKVRNWLNKKYNVTRNNASTYSDTIKKLNPYSLVVGASSYIKTPVKTICKNGQLMLDYNEKSSDIWNYSVFDLIPQRKFEGDNIQRKFSLGEQGWCSFLLDFYLRIKSDLADGTYTIAYRANQFNLAIKLNGDQASLILTIISKNDGKTYTINKLLDKTLFSPSILKSSFKRISLYILPKLIKPDLKNSNGAQDFFNTAGNSTSTWDETLTYQYKLKINQYNRLVEAFSFREDDTFSNISTLWDTSKKIIGVDIRQGGSYSSYSFSAYRQVDAFPDIINAEVNVLIDLQTQIQCKINISDYYYYQTMCVGHAKRPIFKEIQGTTTEFPGQNLVYSNYFHYWSAIDLYNNKVKPALDEYNNKAIDARFDGNSQSVSLTTSQFTVLLPIVSDQILTYVNKTKVKTGPFIPSSFIDNNEQVEFFNSNTYGSKIEGYADSIRVNQIEFNRTSLSQAYAKNLISNGFERRQLIYAADGVTSYELSTDYWDGEFKAEKEWTDNPAWCFYDLLTNKRYGVGNYIPESDVDKWSLYQIAKYCDQLVPDGFGGVEPRFTCNLYIQSQEDALKVLADMASIFRGMFYYSNGFIYAINDMPQSTAVYTFTNANVTDGNFNYESTSLKDRNSAVYVRYIDKNNLYKPAVEYVENIEAIRKFGFRESELTAFGCTSRGQAQRLGRWLLASEYNETETVTFETGPECVYLKPGDVIKIYDYNKKYKTVGGRLNLINISGDSHATTGTFTLDRKLDFNFSGDKNYKLSILAPKFNLDPSFSGAVNSNLDYNEYRKSLVNSFIINSGNLITGQKHDSIQITGLTSVMTSGLNVTGLSYFTGSQGMAPQSIIWSLENSGNLNGSTDSDYDYYRIFRIQESTEGTSYTIMGSQMYHLKYTQIESGLNMTPAIAPTPEASSPSHVLFEVRDDLIVIGIYYNPEIKSSTIGFKIFIKQSYDASFNPNKDSQYAFVPIILDDSKINTTIPKPTEGGEIRVYGTNINNQSPLSYVTAKNVSNASSDSVSIGSYINSSAVNKNSSIQLFGNNFDFKSPISQKRTNYFERSKNIEST